MNHGVAIPKARVFSESQRASYQRMTLAGGTRKHKLRIFEFLMHITRIKQKYEYVVFFVKKILNVHHIRSTTLTCLIVLGGQISVGLR